MDVKSPIPLVPAGLQSCCALNETKKGRTLGVQVHVNNPIPWFAPSPLPPSLRTKSLFFLRPRHGVSVCVSSVTSPDGLGYKSRGLAKLWPV